MTNKEENQKNNDYISLEEATKYCGYSQEYLSLRARQGRLKAAKIGRNWVTTIEWLKGYIEHIEEYKNGNKKLKETEVQTELEKDLPKKEIAYPVYETAPFSFLNFRFGFIFALAIVMIIVFSVLSFNILEKNINNALNNVGAQFSIQITENEIYLATAGYTIEVFKEYKEWMKERFVVFGRSVKNYANNFIEKTKRFFVFWDESEPKKEIAIKDIPEKEEEGIVVLPSTLDDEQLKKRITDSFSDKVRIEMKDELSGLIIPVFREREGDKYMYMLVPVEEDN